MSLQLWECRCYSVDQFRGEDHCYILYLLPFVCELPAMWCPWWHQNDLAALEWFAHSGYGPDALALYNQREFPCRLLMTADLL